jgi:adenylate cyclase
MEKNKPLLKIITLVSVLCVALISFANTDTTKVLKLQQKFKDYFAIDLDSAILINEVIKKETDKQGYPWGQFLAQYNYGRILIWSGKYSSGLKKFKELQVQHKNKPKYLYKINNQLGQIYQTRMLLDSASFFYFEMLRNAESIKDTIGMIESYYAIGNFNSQYGDGTTTLNFLKKAIDLIELIEDKSWNSTINHGIANHYFEENQFEKALESHIYLQSLYDSTEELKRAYGFMNIGACYTELEILDSGILYLSKAHDFFSEQGLVEDVVLSKFNMGVASLNAEKYTLAKQYFEETLKLVGSDFLDYKISTLLALANIDNNLGYSEKAFHLMEDVFALNDSLVNIQMIEQIASMNVKYETEKREEEIYNLNDQNSLQLKRQKLLFIVALMTLIALILIVVLFQNHRRKTKIIKFEKNRSEELLLNILPKETADELKENGYTKARRFENVTILFSDIKNFTAIGEKLSAEDLVKELNHCFSAFDNLLSKYKVEKIKTVGDAYICAGGLPTPYEDSAKETIQVAMDMQSFMRIYQKERKREEKPFFEIRIGVHSGPVVAGIVGIKKFAYDIWGDTVNTSARMEQHCEAGRINVSDDSRRSVEDSFNFHKAREVEVKGKGLISMYYLETDHDRVLSV